MVLPRSLVAAGWPGLAYKEGPEDPPEGVSKRITFEYVYTNLALENSTMIWRRLIGCTDESTNQKSPNFKRKITLNSKKIWFGISILWIYVHVFKPFFFQNSLKLLSQSPQNNKFYFPNFNYTLPPSHPIQFDRNTHFKMYTAVWILYSPYLDARSDLKFSGKRTARSLSIFQATHSYNQASFNMPRSLEKTSQIGCWVVTTTTAIDISALS